MPAKTNLAAVMKLFQHILNGRNGEERERVDQVLTAKSRIILVFVAGHGHIRDYPSPYPA